MPKSRFLPRSLFLKLGLYFVALALPVLLLVESSVLWLEFREFAASVDRGAMQQEVAREAPILARVLAQSAHDPQRLDDALASWLLRLERPRVGIGAQESFVLQELSSAPLGAAVFAADGTLLATAGRKASGLAPDAAMIALLRSGGAQRVAASDAPDFIRRYAVALGPASSPPILLLDLQVPLPWQRLKLSLSFEWPLMVGFLLLFAAGSALFMGWYVTRRLHAIELAASAWSRGDFSRLVLDPADDELGRLAQRLNRMAVDLHALVDTRTALAALSERARLARDLHDTVKQKAFALSLQLAAVKARIDAAGDAAQPLAESRRLAADIQRELAQILDELRPAPAADFAAVVAARAESFQRESGIAACLDLDAAAAVPAEFHDTLARALDEALANVMRHSHASQAWIALRCSDGRCVLSVRDDGRGAADERSGGRGLGHLRERAQALPDGLFEWHSAQGSGVELRISWQSVPGARA